MARLTHKVRTIERHVFRFPRVRTIVQAVATRHRFPFGVRGMAETFARSLLAINHHFFANSMKSDLRQNPVHEGLRWNAIYGELTDAEWRWIW
jgi:hypothetical protein